MNRSCLTALHVMPLIPGHEVELAADAEQLLKAGVCSHVAGMMTLVPESNPPVDKARILGERFVAFRNVFKGDVSRLGILAQATIGHGWVPDEPASFQKIIRPDGTPAYQMCPLDSEFQAYLRATFLHLAALQPAFIMIDDDFRLLSGRGGCYCPLHLAEIGRRLGQAFTRETLLQALRTDPSVVSAFDAVLLDSLLHLAGIIRDAIDATDPALPGSFCMCSGDALHAGRISRRLAGQGQPRVIRINNGRYLCAELRSFPGRMYDAALQIAALDPDVTVLAETDPYPHNRYSTGAALMHVHYAASILEGCHGAKHWLTRTRSYQPASGAAYRAILARHRGFYEALFQAVQVSAPSGYAAAVLPGALRYRTSGDDVFGLEPGKTWGPLLGVLGLPCNYAKMPALPAMMTGAEVDQFTADELRQLLRHGLLLDGAAAEGLCRRGFAADIGVQADPWQDERVSAEKWGETMIGADARYSRITPLGPATRSHSLLLHRKSGVSTAWAELGPAVTLYENAAGGRVATFAAHCGTHNSMTDQGLSFYDEDRKRELVELLEFVCRQPVEFYYPGDAEIYLKVRRFTDGRYLLAFSNLGHDPLETLLIRSAFQIAGIELLTPAGAWEKVGWADGAIQTPLLPAAPAVFRVSVASRENQA